MRFLSRPVEWASMAGKAKKCPFCGSSGLVEVIDFGKVAVAGAFLRKKDFAKEKKYQLTIVFCKDCFAVQVRDHVDPKVLFKHDFYFSSAIKTLRDHFAEYASEVTARFLRNPEKSVVVEFGSNDGVLLKPFADQGVGTVIGVDPAKNIVESVNDNRLTLVNDFFTVPVAQKIIKKYGKADLVCANNVYAHISDINGVTEAITTVMKDDGVFVFEVHYLGKIIQDMQYDMMYHEHIYYYSLLALQNHLARHDMVIFDLKPIPIHGGSYRYYACKSGSKYAAQISKSVEALRKKELDLGYDTAETYTKFASKVAHKREQLMTLLNALSKKGRTVGGYGASGRANTIIQYCGITDKHLSYIIDDAPAKQGLYTPGSHLPICNAEILKTDAPEYLLVFAWSFFNEIASKNGAYIENGGRMIVPLPEGRVTMYPSVTEV